MHATGATAPRDHANTRAGGLPAWLPLAAITLIAAVLRFAALGRQSLWFDEAATWQLTQLPFGEMLSALPDRESNPPLFYVLEWLATRALGDGEAGLRALSAVAGTLVVPVAFAIARRIGGRPAGLATAALVAVNPLLIWFSQEARNYQLVVLLSAVSLLLFLRALEDDRPRLIAWWALVSALALCTHYFAAFALAPQAAWLLWRHPRRGAVTAAIAALALTGAALLPLLLTQSDNPYDIAGQSLAIRFLQLPKQFLIGYRGPLGLPLGLLGGALCALALALLLRRERDRDRALPVAVVAAGALLLPLLAAVVGADYVNARNLLPALVPLLALLGAGFVAGRTRAGVAGLGVLCAASVAIAIAVAVNGSYQRDDWKGLAAAIGSTREPRALVVSPANGEAVLRYYLGPLPAFPAQGERVAEVDVVSVAVAPRPGDERILPGPTAPDYGPGLGAPREVRGDGWVMLRFRPASPQTVEPLPLTAVRFSLDLPAVLLQPAGR